MFIHESQPHYTVKAVALHCPPARARLQDGAVLSAVTHATRVVWTVDCIIEPIYPVGEFFILPAPCDLVHWDKEHTLPLCGGVCGVCVG